MTFANNVTPESLCLIGAALALQHATCTAANIIPIPGGDRFITIGTALDVARLLEIAPAGGSIDVLDTIDAVTGKDIAGIACFETERFYLAGDVDGLVSRAARQIGQQAQQLEERDAYAVSFIEQRAAQYLQDHADTEPSTGALVFQYGEAGREYHSTLVDLAEDIRTALRQADTQATAACVVPPAGWYCTRAPGHEGPCAAHRVKAPATTDHDHSEGSHHD